METASRDPKMRAYQRAAVTVSVAILAVGCSSSSTGRSVAGLTGHPNESSAGGLLTQAQSDQAMVDFTRCLRGHGVAEPDPLHRPGHVGLSVEVPAPGPATNAALSACNHFIGPIEQAKQAGARAELAAWLPALTRYAECMRAHDIAMLDPNSVGSLNLGNVPGIASDFGRYSPQFRAADGQCRHLLPAAVHDDGTGP